MFRKVFSEFVNSLISHNHKSPHMKHLFLFPTELEARSFRELCPDAEIVISGVGMAETAATISRLSVDGSLARRVVVLAGIAGAYADRCAVGDVVEVVTETMSELPERFRKCYNVKAYSSRRKVKANTVSRCEADDCGADVENMEGAVLFAMAEALGFRAVEIRAVSNIVGDDFAKWDMSLAVNNLAYELKKLE